MLVVPVLGLLRLVFEALPLALGQGLPIFTYQLCNFGEGEGLALQIFTDF